MTDPLILRVCVEIGRGRITEARIDDAQSTQCDGYVENGRITINVIHATVDTVIHECLHRLYPSWTEHGVRTRTGRLMRKSSASEIQAIYDEYQIQKRRRKSPKVVGDDD